MLDLWPEDIGSSSIRTPVAILREQASVLGQKTKNVVEAEVVTIQPEPWADPDNIFYAFYIVAPALGGYRYRLFALSHRFQLYPLLIKLDHEIFEEIPYGPFDKSPAYTTIKIESEAELIEALGTIFGTMKTRRIVHALLAQSGSNPEASLPEPKEFGEKEER